ncbi:MAG: TraX family protein [Lachnospiraceae bacterium]
MENRRGISGNGLKLIALLSMLTDHFGAVVVERTRVFNQFDTQFWDTIYGPLRSVGRLAFPIFCFLLVEGFIHTKDVKKYFFRLLLFAFLSEIPFNLALTGNIWDERYQNVFWELTLGLLVMWLIRLVEEKQFSFVIQTLWKLLVITAGMAAGEWLSLDYGLYGIFSIGILYLCRGRRFNQLLAGAATFLWENPAPVAFIPIAFYNGKRGRGLKYAFYIFYPAHLLILYAIARVIGCPY